MQTIHVENLDADEALLQRTLAICISGAKSSSPERGWRIDWKAKHLEAPAEALHRATLRTNAHVSNDREARIRDHSERVDRELKGGKHRRLFRGRRCPVVRLTDPDEETGGLRVFTSASAAGASVGRFCDNVIQSIKRKGTCGGHRFAYFDELQNAGRLVTTGDGRTVFVPNDPSTLLPPGPARSYSTRDAGRPIQVQAERVLNPVESPEVNGEETMSNPENRSPALAKCVLHLDETTQHLLKAVTDIPPEEVLRMVPEQLSRAHAEREQLFLQLELLSEEIVFWSGKIETVMDGLKRAARQANLASENRMELAVAPETGEALAVVRDLAIKHGSLEEALTAVAEDTDGRMGVDVSPQTGRAVLLLGELMKKYGSLDAARAAVLGAGDGEGAGRG